MKRITIALAIVVVTSVAMSMSGSVSAHFTAVSAYTYWRDVVPILDARCGRCHTAGSASGLSLLNYQSARGATWLIRQRLIRSHMPPWYAEGPFRSPDSLTARELNILMTWASGGAPEGKPLPRKAQEGASWTLGQPDLVVSMPSAFTFSTAEGDRVHEVRLPSAKVAGRMVRAVDLLPGTPALVRSAEIIARSGNRDQVLGLWQPGELPSPLALNAGFRLPSDAILILRIRYRRIYGAPASDRSDVGVYFADRRAAAVQAFELSADAARPQSQIVRRPMRLVAIRPRSGPSGALVSITVAAANGSERSLGRIEIQRDWARRYVLETPIELATGDRIVMSVRPAQSELWNSLTSERTEQPSPAVVVFETVPRPTNQ